MPLKVKSQIVGRKKERKPPAKVIPKYRASTLSKIRGSIEFAERRYGGDDTVLTASNFRVVKQNHSDPTKEEVVCSIKVGKKKWRILEGSQGELVDEIKIAGSDLVCELTGFHEFVENLDPNSDDALAFKKLAIEQAWPPLDQVQKELYFYDEESDQIFKK